MIYRVDEIQVKNAKTGKPFATLFLKDETGAEFKGLMFKDFQDIRQGDEIEGEIRPWKDAAIFVPKKHETRTFAPKKTQSYTSASVAVAQANKERGIQVSLALGKAVDISLASIKDVPFPTDADFKAEIRRWRDWLSDEFKSEQDRLKDEQ